ADIVWPRSRPKIVPLWIIAQRTEVVDVVDCIFERRFEIGEKRGVLKVGPGLVGKGIGLHWAGNRPSSALGSYEMEVRAFRFVVAGIESTIARRGRPRTTPRNRPAEIDGAKAGWNVQGPAERDGQMC